MHAAMTTWIPYQNHQQVFREPSMPYEKNFDSNNGSQMSN
jgi:hypothetical protein